MATRPPRTPLLAAVETTKNDVDDVCGTGAEAGAGATSYFEVHKFTRRCFCSLSVRGRQSGVQDKSQAVEHPPVMSTYPNRLYATATEVTHATPPAMVVFTTARDGEGGMRSTGMGGGGGASKTRLEH